MAWLDKVKTEVSRKEREVIEKVMVCAVTAGAIGKEIFECDRAIDLSGSLLIDIDKFQELAEKKQKANEITMGDSRSIKSFLQCKKESIETVRMKLQQKLTEYEESKQQQEEE